MEIGHQMKAFDRVVLKAALKDKVVEAYKKRNSPPDLYSNTLDCFSAVIDATLLSKSLDDWRNDVEETRQTQKSIQNIVGELHEIVLGTIDGYENLKVGKVIDVISSKHKLIAEIKNKHNTTKGNHRVEIYDSLKTQLDTEYKGYSGYYVEILPPSNSKKYDKPFTPSDNKIKDKAMKNRPSNEKIRLIDGRSFYAKVTGHSDAIDELYNELPSILKEILKEYKPELEFPDLGEDLRNEMFSKAFL